MATVRRIDSIGNYNIVNTGIFDEVSSLTAGSLSFNGSSQYLSIASTALLNFGTGDYTVEGWFYWTSVTAGQAKDRKSTRLNSSHT